MILFISLLSRLALAQQTCLSLVAEKPRLAVLNVDDIYYDAETLEEFADQFLGNVLNHLNATTGCQISGAAFAEFKCIGVNGDEHNIPSPICGGMLNGYSLAVVKDYVDSARLIVQKKDPAAEIILPGVNPIHDDTSLYLPDTGYCSMGLLDGGMDSQVFQFNLRSYLPSSDKRFLMAQTLRSYVEVEAQYNSSCEYVVRTLATSSATCSVLPNSDFEYCALTSTNAGYFYYFWMNDKSLSNAVYLRWD